MQNNTDKQAANMTPDQASKMFDAWTEVLKLPTIGPMYAFSKDFASYADGFAKLGKIMAEMKGHLDAYWGLINTAYAKATKDTVERSPKQFATKEDFDNYRKAMIESFEDAFTGLFASPEFSAVYGKVFSSQMDMSKAMQNITEKNFKALNLPTRSEVDEILKDVHELKRVVRDLKKGMETLKNDATRV
jgi:hypothetical protein